MPNCAGSTDPYCTGGAGRPSAFYFGDGGTPPLFLWLDLPRIGEFLRSRKIPFCVDGIQTLGAFPTPAAHADFIAADAHKWLLGPCGAGLLYVSRAAQERLRPVEYGWNNIRNPNYVAQEQIVFRTNAGRYEAGTLKILNSSNSAFTAAVKDALPRMKFSAAQIGGKKVQQLVQMPFQFHITH